ncbi:DNA polymerase epsilon subunit C [Cynara cardunculus var. scolymus]|uniref:Histone-fold n=1 Tax=Cynara cardunculus var. scolymus TaxID=59895 RepID=A0A103Y0E2_CYNCS|nr:DNA polymerase epsilon subunit C [Cynara cardunculus var. scolymus]KVI00220.1 Histone-fold [Cynara cardunculus var. scolymus]
MEEEQKAERGGSTPAPAKANGKRKVKKDFEEENTPDKVPIILSSSSNSHNHVNNGAKSESSEEEEQRQVEVSGEKDVVDDSVEAEDAANSTDASNKKKKAKKEVKEDKNQKKKKKKRKEEIEEKESSSLYQIPMNRVSRIIKSEDPNIRISQEAVFIINKASEKFLQLFTTEAYASAFLDRKKHIDYKHLSSVISKRRRFDFLSDFVPEKVKAEDALKESSPTVET